MKKIVIVAGTGFLGKSLLQYFNPKTREIIVLTRQTLNKEEEHVEYIKWNINKLDGWEKHLEDTDLLINLAGKSVDCRYNEKNKEEILYSRIQSTRILNQAINQCKRPPKHFINSSTATIYIHSETTENDEYKGVIGDDFSMNVAKNWEKVFYEIKTPNTIKTAIRTSIVLGKSGGAFIPLKILSKIGLGGKQGSGNQYISWIHIQDFCRAIDFIAEKKLEGNINIVSPKPIKNKDFMKELRTKLKIPFGISQPKWLLEIGAIFMRTETELVLKSRNVIPKRLLENEFTFEYTTVDNCFNNLIT